MKMVLKSVHFIIKQPLLGPFHISRELVFTFPVGMLADLK